MNQENKPCCEKCESKSEVRDNGCQAVDCPCHHPHSLDAVVEEFKTQFGAYQTTSNQPYPMLVDWLRTALKTYGEAQRKEERERIENELDKFIAPHPLSLGDSVWLKRLLNKVFQHDTGTN